MTKRGLPLIAGLAALAACGGDGDTRAANARAGDERAPERSGSASNDGAPDTAASGDENRGTKLRVRRSQFGRMLFDSERQAIYIFERDRKRRSVCYGACARAWPPVLTAGAPVAGKGVRAGLLGTVRRRGGKRQVTYAGRPLYYYAHEEPGEVRCHNVNLNGGFWWVVGPAGKRRP
jgi:predicted lipoprotein with Yx(FWY)xxD motif